MERIIKGHEIRDGNDVWGGGGGFMLGEAKIRHMKLPWVPVKR